MSKYAEILLKIIFKNFKNNTAQSKRKKNIYIGNYYKTHHSITTGFDIVQFLIIVIYIQ